MRKQLDSLTTVAMLLLAGNTASISMAIESTSPSGTYPVHCCVCETVAINRIGGLLTVTFDDGTTDEEIEQIADAVGAKIFYRWDEEAWIFEVMVPWGREYEYISRFEEHSQVASAYPIDYGCIPGGDPCPCCVPNFICDPYTLQPCVALRPVTLAIDKSSASPGYIALDWHASCPDSDADDHTIYSGAIGRFDSHTPVVCTDAPPHLSATISPLPDDRYYLVVPIFAETGEEGTYGTDSRGIERLVGESPCYPSGNPSDPYAGRIINTCDGPDLSRRGMQPLTSSGVLPP